MFEQKKYNPSYKPTLINAERCKDILFAIVLLPTLGQGALASIADAEE